MAYLWLSLSAFCSVFASIALKLGAGANINRTTSFLSLNEIIYYVTAVGAYGVGFILYAVALRRLDLSLAYPMMVAIAVLGVISYGQFFGNEAITSTRLLGATLIAVGVFLLNR